MAQTLGVRDSQGVGVGVVASCGSYLSQVEGKNILQGPASLLVRGNPVYHSWPGLMAHISGNREGSPGLDRPDRPHCPTSHCVKVAVTSDRLLFPAFCSYIKEASVSTGDRDQVAAGWQ